MGSFLTIKGRGPWWDAMRTLAKKINSSLVAAENIPGWQKGADGRMIPPIGFGSSSSIPRQLQIRTGPEDNQAQIKYGEVSGMGFNDVITGMTIGDWDPYSVGTSGLAFFLRVEFEPVAEERTVSDGAGDVQSTYVVGSGGTNAAVTITTTTYAASRPTDTDPEVNPDTGAVTVNGIYYRRIGGISSNEGTIDNSFHGPLIIAFCSPNGFKHFEVTNG
jgi:hypothetical protein